MAAVTKAASDQRPVGHRTGINRRVFRNNLDGWLFASPWIIGFILWTLGPMLASLFISFTDWDLITTPQFVGAENFVTIVQRRSGLAGAEGHDDLRLSPVCRCISSSVWAWRCC